MISPKEIQEQCLKWWRDVLLFAIDSKSYFPKDINRIGKIGSKDILNKLSSYKVSFELLKNNSKDIKKQGYRIILADKQFDKIGKQPVPDKIVIESIEDYLQITKKEKEYQTFLKNYSLVLQELPILLEWVRVNPFKLIEHDTWIDTLKVCKYFLKTPKPNLYIRQLPIDIHTKYILENKNIIQLLLEFLISEHINATETRFETRFNLKYSEPLIRVRILDKAFSPLKNATDISLALSEFKNYEFQCNNVIVAENIMNFLTLPLLTRTIAIWSGGGFNVSHLKDIEWLITKQFYYWGDIDAQGFQILNQFRTYFPNTIAVMMDEETLSNFKYSEGQKTTNHNLPKLSNSELELYDHLKKKNIRLEQEKITQMYAEEKIKKLIQNNYKSFDL